MSPAEIKIMLHHYACPDPYPPTEGSPAFVATCQQKFVDEGLLVAKGPGVFACTVAGHEFIDALRDVEVPKLLNSTALIIGENGKVKFGTMHERTHTLDVWANGRILVTPR